ncbi:ABC transporter permease [Blastococcus sp. TF02-8]|uniref:FtsX-like permease family protein n=1 Tax=Blastococcus sp. TF02-8 TaxID=2250574 RepID=UPI000DEAB0F8|nr:FtsX-like permease family protein [Blastococcus sp. TF02-8]RBY97135.1 ABC transporter permease [Blastococcus sp. TF02-8]
MTSGGLRPWHLVREALVTARVQRVPTVVTALVVAAVCGVVFATTGQSAAAEQRVLSRLGDVGSRTIVAEDVSGAAGMSARSVYMVSRLDGVQWALGVGPVVDVRNAVLGSAGPPVPGRLLYGDVPAEIRVGGRLPAAGEALVSPGAQQVLGLAQPVGGVMGAELDAALVGSFTAVAPLDGLNDGVLLRGPDRVAEPTLRRLYVLVEEVDDVEVLAAATRAALSADDATQIRVEVSTTVLDLREVVAGDLGSSGRRMMLLVWGVGLVLIATTLFAAVSSRRREFGRRRALGASRPVIVAVVVLHGLVAAGIGAGTGTAIGLITVWRTAGALPAAEFTAGVAVTAILVALVASLPPALTAAYRDPVRILRVA